MILAGLSLNVGGEFSTFCKLLFLNKYESGNVGTTKKRKVLKKGSSILFGYLAPQKERNLDNHFTLEPFQDDQDK